MKGKLAEAKTKLKGQENSHFNIIYYLKCFLKEQVYLHLVANGNKNSDFRW